MPRRILPHLETLSTQIHNIISHYRRMLDDEFLFSAAVQVPQVATIFDRIRDKSLRFGGEDLSLIELLTLIAYRYGFENVQVMGHGGYAIVLGHKDDPDNQQRQRRVLRLVPEHHVRNIVAQPDAFHEFDVHLNAGGEPIRNTEYPLLLSDLFLMPRHTTKLVFYEPDGEIAQAGGYPASLHCQLLPEVRAFNKPQINQRMAKESGALLESALATLGVSVADAHGGNGGSLIGADGQPLIHEIPDQPERAYYVPIVLDYGYYAQIGARTLASILVHHGVTAEIIQTHLRVDADDIAPDTTIPWLDRLAQLIGQSDLPRSAFGQLLYRVQSDFLNPYIWIDPAEYHWQTTKEKTYPPLQAQARLEQLYPDYDEVIFPQRIETYTFNL
ncbi:MAG: hypothetical protein RLP44_08510 [Aggregatilineales bacterium]